MSAILTWIAHGSVLVALATFVMRLGRGPNAATRYSLWWAVMAAVLAMPVAHAISTPAPVSVDPAQRPATEIAAAPSATPIDQPLFVVPQQVAAGAPWFATLLAGLVCWRLLALARAAARLRGVRGRCVPVPDELEAQLPVWRAARDSGRRVQLLATLDLPTPALLGAPPGDRGLPIIALPVWTIEALDPESLDLIVLHELAHVERGDDRDLLVQSAIEAIFCWHPAVRWIGRQLDDERERACDDEVVRRTDRAAQYARCLVGVAAHAEPGPALLAAPGVGRPGRRLALRVERVLASTDPRNAPRARVRRHAWVSASLAALACAVVVSAAGAPRVHVPEPNWGRIRTSTMASLAMSSHPGPFTVAPREAPSLRAEPAFAPPAALPAETGAPETPAMVQATRRADFFAAHDQAAAVVETSSLSETAPVEPAHVAVSLSVADLLVGAAVRAETPTFTSGGLLLSTPIVPASLRSPSAPAPLAFAAMSDRLRKRPVDAGGYIGRGAAQAGESIGKGAAQAGVKTAGFFSRMGRAVAGSF